MKTKIVLGVLAIVILIGAFMLLQKDNASEANQPKAHQDTLDVHEISPGDVAEKIKKGEEIVLLDVRTPEEYEEIHLQNAALLPVQKLSALTLADIGLGEEAKDKEIIIYCRSGARSKTAYDIMKSLGYTNIKSVAGGMTHWEEDLYPFTQTGAYTGPSMMTNNGDISVSEDSPRVSLDSTFYDFGIVPQYGGTVKETFVVKNNGTKTLTVGDITTSCSCTSATISSTSIEPGQSAKLTVIFDPDFHEEPLGVFKRTVFIPTNDPTTPEAQVVIQVNIDEGK